jgi:putative endonuclease
MSLPPGAGSPVEVMYYVYILKSLINKTYYIGQTKNLKVRIEQHNSAKKNGYTKRFAPYVLVYKEEFDNRTDAIKRERLIKSYKGGTAFERLINVRR